MKAACREIEPLLAGYALGALDPGERARVDAHLSSCALCSASAADYQGVAGALLVTSPRTPPPRARARLLARFPARDSGTRRVSWLTWPRAVSALALFGLVLVNVTLLQQTRSVLDGQQALSRRLVDQQTAMALMSYPSTETASVTGDQAYGTFVYNPEMRLAVLNAWGLEPLGPAQTYQAWLVTSAGDHVNAGTFTVQADVPFATLVIHSPAPLSQYGSIGVTIEPAGGSVAPTGPRVLHADI